MKSDFEERKARIAVTSAERATKAIAARDAAYSAAAKIASYIPMGQPILVGHHSEKRHRRALARMDALTRKSINENDKAKYYKRRAEAAVSNTAIFSDDPNVVEKLAEKVERLEKRQEMMKAVNKLVRKNDKEGLLDMGFSETTIEALFKPDFCGKIGFADYQIANNGANIRRLKKRLELEEKAAKCTTAEITINGVIIKDNVEDNRLQMFFDGKPSDEIRAELKANGFRWAPSVGAWMRSRGNASVYHASRIAKQVQS